MYSFYTSSLTASSTNTTNLIWNIDLCRECNHSHVVDGGCYDISKTGMVSFIACICKEYVPKDNLKYLEYLYNKRQDKESL